MKTEDVVTSSLLLFYLVACFHQGPLIKSKEIIFEPNMAITHYTIFIIFYFILYLYINRQIYIKRKRKRKTDTPQILWGKNIWKSQHMTTDHGVLKILIIYKEKIKITYLFINLFEKYIILFIFLNQINVNMIDVAELLNKLYVIIMISIKNIVCYNCDLDAFSSCNIFYNIIVY